MCRPDDFPPYICADCGQRPATTFLPEGRYLCSPCWTALRELRQRIYIDTSRRYNARRKEISR